MIKKSGIDSSYTLKECLQDLKNRGLMQELLQSDENIKNDELQYKSDLHGVSHTRRVNFFATLIINSESNIDDKTKRLVKAFVINHDIGRENDEEDKQHGENSSKILENNIGRIEGLDDSQIEQLKFVIKEHSLSSRQNQEDIDSLFQEKIQKDKLERFNKMPKRMKEGKTIDDLRPSPSIKKEQEYLEQLLAICKDSDKLDRVRLDPTGIYPREGLDTSRLSLESSKKLENIAYESLDKILRILDIEKEQQKIEEDLEQIDELNELQNDYQNSEIAEQKFTQAREICNRNKKSFLMSMVKDRSFSKIAQIPKKIKEIFLSKKHMKGDLVK